MKPTIFISHISEEAPLAQLFKDAIEREFLGLVNLFMSSDARSVGLGQNWLNEITDSLRACQAMLVFCSPQSVGRPWINFESGAGWARNIEIAPLCHSGMTPAKLPIPLVLLQGIQASYPNSIDRVFRMIATKLGSAVPTFDSIGLAQSVALFESDYAIRSDVVVHLQEIKMACPELFDSMKNAEPHSTVAIDIVERLVERMYRSLDELKAGGHLNYSFQITGFAGVGVVGRLQIAFDQHVKEGLSRLT